MNDERVIGKGVGRMLMPVVWTAVAVLGAMSYAVITRLVKPTEQINALWLVVAAACTFALAYRFYGKFLAAKLELSDKAVTPAIARADGRDFHATNRWVLFGHHFAAIAGAGPLIGPVLAAQFGYLPGALWILIGAVLAGAVQDFVVLVASIRRDGCSLAEIAAREIGPVGGVAASLAVVFIIIITLAGLGLAVVNALTHSPWGTFTIACTIPIGLFMGLYMYRIRPGRVVETSVIGVALLLGAVALGHEIIGTPLEKWFTLERETLVWSMAGYGFIASVLPVWMLLCPRDYLSTYMKIGTMALLAGGIIVLAPELRMPATTQFMDGGGPVIPGAVFPFLFITIACGAVSGFHALVSSGTTPKMITRETDALMIGFGAMLMEGFVAIMALIAATLLAPGDYFAINTTLGADVLTKMGFAPERIQELSTMVGTDVRGRPGGAVSLAVGMASIFSALPGMKGLMAYWYNFALMFEALFILTMVDTGTRVARFLLQEMGGHFYTPLRRHSWMPGTIITSAIVTAAWGALIHTGSISNIWPMFGVSNQLLAGLALAIGTTLILKKRKTKYAWVTATPMAFMLVLTLTAAWKLVIRFWGLAEMEPKKRFVYHLDAVLVAAMAALAIIILVDALRMWRRTLAEQGIGISVRKAE